MDPLSHTGALKSWDVAADKPLNPICYSRFPALCSSCKVLGGGEGEEPVYFVKIREKKVKLQLEKLNSRGGTADVGEFKAGGRVFGDGQGSCDNVTVLLLGLELLQLKFCWDAYLEARQPTQELCRK